jgi:hypothetical protein
MNLFAYTETRYKDYPGFISINKEEEGDVSISVRSPERGGMEVAAIRMSHEQFQNLLYESAIKLQLK